MGKRLTKKRVKEALHTARKVEKHRLLSKEKVVKIHKEGVSITEKLRKLLRPSWFVKDLDEKKPKKKKSLNR